MIGLQDGLFFRTVTHLSSHGRPSNLKVQFMTHSRLVKGYLAFTYFIKYQYIGVPWDALDVIFWNFEYLTPGPFGRLLSADFSKTKIRSDLHAKAMRNFGP